MGADKLVEERFCWRTLVVVDGRSPALGLGLGSLVGRRL
jgi:hypothetical protein